MPEVQNDRGELEMLAEKIVAEVGASEAPRDNALVTLAKGMSEALTTLVKGKAMPKGDSDVEDEDEASGRQDNDEGATPDDKDDDTDDGDEGGATYEDMRMGQPGDDAEFLDATEFLAAMSADLKAMRKGQASLRAELTAIRQENADLRATVKALDGASRRDVGGVLEAMAKGVIGLHETLRSTPLVPAASLSPSMQGKFRVVRESLDGVEKSTNITTEQMFKAIQTRLIDEDQYRAWKAGQLVDADLLTKIRAL